MSTQETELSFADLLAKADDDLGTLSGGSNQSKQSQETEPKVSSPQKPKTPSTSQPPTKSTDIAPKKPIVVPDQPKKSQEPTRPTPSQTPTKTTTSQPSASKTTGQTPTPNPRQRPTTPDTDLAEYVQVDKFDAANKGLYDQILKLNQQIGILDSRISRLEAKPLAAPLPVGVAPAPEPTVPKSTSKKSGKKSLESLTEGILGRQVPNGKYFFGIEGDHTGVYYSSTIGST